MKPFYEIIRELREDHDYSQTFVADYIGRTQAQYSRYESGEHVMPMDIAIKLADLYNVSLDYLSGRIYERYSGDKERMVKQFTSTYSYEQLLTDAAVLRLGEKKELESFMAYLKSKKQ